MLGLPRSRVTYTRPDGAVIDQRTGQMIQGPRKTRVSLFTGSRRDVAREKARRARGGFTTTSGGGFGYPSVKSRGGSSSGSSSRGGGGSLTGAEKSFGQLTQKMANDMIAMARADQSAGRSQLQGAQNQALSGLSAMRH